MFFYLISNSNLFKKSISGHDKYIKLLIYGTIAYIFLHAVLFVGGPDSLFYNFRYYFWIFLALDICVLLATDVNKEDSPLQKLFSNGKDEIKNEYRVQLQNASINDIMKDEVPENNLNLNGNDNRRDTDNANANRNVTDNETRKSSSRKKKKKVKFDFSKNTEREKTDTVSANIIGGSTDLNKFSQPINNPNKVGIESILKTDNVANKSVPLDTLMRQRASNPADFTPNIDDNDGYQSFSDSESEFSLDLDLDSFEKGLTM